MKSFLLAFGGALAGGAIAAVTFKVIGLPRIHLGLEGGATLLLGFVPLMLLAVGVHEAGHLFTGAAVGFRPCLFIAGPLKLERVDGRWRIGRNRSISWLGGLAAGIPDNIENLRKRLLLLVAGGPAASALSGALAIALLAASGSSSTTRATFSGLAAGAYFLLLAFALLSLLIAFIALVPGTKTGYNSDGSQILRYMRGGPQVEADVALMALSLSSMAGSRPRDWDGALLARAMTLPPESGRGAIARLLAHINALDRQEVATAREYLDTTLAHLEQIPMMSRASVLLQAAQFAALYDGDARAARAALNRATGGALVSSSEQLFTAAAVLHAEEGSGVEELLDEAEAALPDSMDRGSSQLRKDQIARLRQLRATDAKEGRVC